MTELKGLNGDQATMPLHPGYGDDVLPILLPHVLPVYSKVQLQLNPSGSTVLEQLP